MVNTPVLFETFVRDDYARKVWDAIKEAQPRKLYFYSNKGRAEKGDEIERNNRIRSWIEEVDWECDLHTWFREECVDVYTSLKGAVDWVCETEEEWIVLEDDVVPSPAFFSFCDQLLDYYRNDKRVWLLSGDNFFNYNPSGYDYIFTRYHWIFGWATWRDRWLAVDWTKLRFDEMLEQGVYQHFYKTDDQMTFMIESRKNLKEFIEQSKCWDYYFGITCDQNNGVQIVPSQHLVTNIGLSGTHSKYQTQTFINAECNYKGSEYIIKKHPPFVFADLEYDYLTYKGIYWYSKPLWKRLVISTLRWLKLGKTVRKILK